MEPNSTHMDWVSNTNLRAELGIMIEMQRAGLEVSVNIYDVPWKCPGIYVLGGSGGMDPKYYFYDTVDARDNDYGVLIKALEHTNTTVGV